MGSGAPGQLKIRFRQHGKCTEARPVSIAAAARCSGPRARPSALLVGDGDRPAINSAGAVRGSRERGGRSTPPRGRIHRRTRCRRRALAPGAGILALKTTDAETPPTALTAVAGISYAVFSQLWGSRVRVINLSWHVLETTPLLRPTIQFAGNPHLLELRPCVVVIAAGNYGSDNADIPPTLPASYGLLNTIVTAASQLRPGPPV